MTHHLEKSKLTTFDKGHVLIRRHLNLKWLEPKDRNMGVDPFLITNIHVPKTQNKIRIKAKRSRNLFWEVSRLLIKKYVVHTSLAVKGTLAHRLQRRITCKIQKAARGPQNGRWGLERCLPLGFWAF